MTDAEYKFEVRRRKHALGYALKPPSPPLATWRAPEMSEQEQEERNKLIESGQVPF